MGLQPDVHAVSLDALLAELAACRVCRDAPRFGPALPHHPRPVIQADARARLCIASQAPGLRVHQSGRPFTDASGVRLRAWLGLDEATFYDASKVAIVPMGHCFPGYDAKGADLPPRRECAPIWRRRVFAALPNIELILLVGQYARNWHLPELRGAKTASAVRAFESLLARPGKPRALVLPHPSWRNSGWLKANPWFEADLLPVLRAEVARIVG